MIFSKEALAGQVVVVIGGTSGLGLATAQAARDAGAHVLIGGRSAERLGAVAENGGFEPVQIDATDELAMAALFARLDRVDHVFVTAGEGVVGPVSENSFAKLRPTLDAKVTAAFHVGRFAGPRIRPGGSITLVSGLAAWRPFVGGTTAAAGNAGVEAMGRVLALELKPVRVNTIVPGVIDTPMLNRVFGAEREKALVEVAGSLPVGRAGRSEDIAHAVLFLMTNGFVTGSTLHVDGGALVI